MEVEDSGEKECVELSGHDERVWHVCWSPCGRILASCGADKVIRLWTADAALTAATAAAMAVEGAGGGAEEGEDGQKKKKKNKNNNFAAHEVWVCVATLEDVQSRTIRSCEFSPCGSYLAAASFDSTTVIWQRGRKEDSNHMEWECVATLEGHENEVKSVSWSHDGKYIATCSRDKSIWIWEAPPPTTPNAILQEDEEVECECISVLTGHTQDVKFVKWHPKAHMLFSASYDDTIRVWTEQVDDWGCTDLLQGHKNTVWGLALEPTTGDTVASCSQDCSIRFWSRDERGKFVPGEVIESRHERTIFSIDWSPHANCIATCGGDDAIIIHKTTTTSSSDDDQLTDQSPIVRRIDAAHSSDVNGVRWNPVRSGCLASCGDDGLVKIWFLEL